MDKAEADKLFQSGVEHQQAGRLDAAQTDYERVLESYPMYPHVPHLLGAIAGQRGDWFLARRLIESSLVANPKDADALSNLAWSLYHLGLHDQAIRRCVEALGHDENHARAWFVRGLALHQNRLYPEAIASYDKALTLRADMFEAMNHRGRSLHVLERYEEAVAAYDAALAHKPDFADAINNRGSALTMLGRHPEAMDSYQRALQIDPRFPEALFNYGLCLQTQERLEEALQAYEAALSLRPTHAEALLYRAHVMQRLGRMPQLALSSLDRALTVRPDYFEAIHGRAGILGQLDQYAEALEAYDQVIAMRPNLPEAHHNRGHALRELGRLEEAAGAYREAIRLGGDARGGMFVLAAMGEGETPAIAPQDFIVSLFDRYAKRFDDHLVNILNYRAHEFLCAEILKIAPQGAFDIADLGCGTGLCAPLLAPIARSMTGVDLAPRMLDTARQRDIYTALVQDDVASFLGKSAAASFDMLVSTDVFIYIGDLTDVFKGARHAIRAGGLFGFSIETIDKGDFELRSSRRYAQSLAYIRRLAAANGFEVLVEEPCALRKERGVDTPGHIIVLRAR